MASAAFAARFIKDCRKGALSLIIALPLTVFAVTDISVGGMSNQIFVLGLFPVWDWRICFRYLFCWSSASSLFVLLSTQALIQDQISTSPSPQSRGRTVWSSHRYYYLYFNNYDIKCNYKPNFLAFLLHILNVLHIMISEQQKENIIQLIKSHDPR